MILFQDLFAKPDGLYTTERHYWDKTIPASMPWEMTSGSCFIKNKRLYSGIPVNGNPDNTGTPNHSNVFRLNTKQRFNNIKVSFLLNVKQYVSCPKVGNVEGTPLVDYDGIHIFLGYQTQYTLYYASVCRRDGNVVIKKKVEGGPSNNGTYTAISAYKKFPFPLNTDVRVKATIQNLPDGSVKIQLYSKGVLLVEAIDVNAGGIPAITAPGCTGIRGDNCEFEIDEFTVENI